MQLAAALDTADEGSVFLGDQDLTKLKDKALTRLRRDQIGFVFQAFNLLPTLTAEENITLPLALGGHRPEKEWLDTVVSTVGLGDRLNHRPSELSGGQQQRVAVARALAGKKVDPEWLATVVETVGLANRLHHKPSELSGGQQQRVAVARTLASRPEIIFADEPTGNLDSRTGAEILTFMRTAVQDLGQSIVMVTHDPVAASYADRAVFLADGRIVDEIDAPTAGDVLDRIKTLGG